MNLLRRFRHLCLPLVGGWLVSGGIAQAESLQAAALKFPGLRVGAALNPDTLSGNEAVYANTVRFQFNLPSPENATKWGAFRPAQYSFDWADADVFARFARAGGQRVRGHTLVWHNSIPTWLTGGGFTPDQNRDLLFHHIDAVVGRYRSEIFCWDVVNEAFNNDGTLRNSFWYNQPGIGYATNGTRYIEEAFRRAALADPNAELLYNDYDAETLNEKSDSIYAMAQDFLNRGVPLHGIGFQMHRTDLNYDSLRSNFKRFNDLGLNLHITEMDIRILVTNAWRPRRTWRSRRKSIGTLWAWRWGSRASRCCKRGATRTSIRGFRDSFRATVRRCCSMRIISASPHIGRCGT